MSLLNIPSSRSIKSELLIPSSEQIKLMSEIEERKQKIQQYLEIENQLHAIQNDIATTKKIKPEDILTGRTLNKLPEKRNQGNKKVRIYELQRKLVKLKTESFQNQELVSIKKKEMENVVQQIMQKEENIHKATQKGENLSQKLLESDETIKKEQINSRKLTTKVEEADGQINKYEFEVKKLRDSVFKLGILSGEHKKIGISLLESKMETIDWNLTPSLQTSQIFFDQGHFHKDTGITHPSMFEDEVIEQSIIEDEVSTSRSRQALLLWQQTEKLDELETAQSIQYDRKNELFNFQKEITTMIGSKKHHGVNIGLLNRKIERVSKKNQDISQEIIFHETLIEQILSELSSLQGKRGEIRAKLGITVDQNQLIQALNYRLSQDASTLMTGIQELNQNLSRIRNTEENKIQKGLIYNPRNNEIMFP